VMGADRNVLVERDGVLRLQYVLLCIRWLPAREPRS